MWYSQASIIREFPKYFLNMNPCARTLPGRDKGHWPEQLCHVTAPEMGTKGPALLGVWHRLACSSVIDHPIVSLTISHLKYDADLRTMFSSFLFLFPSHHRSQNAISCLKSDSSKKSSYSLLSLLQVIYLISKNQTLCPSPQASTAYWNTFEKNK